MNIFCTLKTDKQNDLIYQQLFILSLNRDANKFEQMKWKLHVILPYVTLNMQWKDLCVFTFSAYPK